VGVRDVVRLTFRLDLLRYAQVDTLVTVQAGAYRLDGSFEVGLVLERLLVELAGGRPEPTSLLLTL
jgi:hypothetical protein